jgi:hypothetical protein
LYDRQVFWSKIVGRFEDLCRNYRDFLKQPDGQKLAHIPRTDLGPGFAPQASLRSGPAHDPIGSVEPGSEIAVCAGGGEEFMAAGLSWPGRQPLLLLAA